MGPMKPILLAVAACLVLGKKVPNSRIKHMVVLMEENRSFDHMMGWLNTKNPEINGLNAKDFNYLNPHDKSSKKIYVNTTAPYVAQFDPSHSVSGTTEKVFGEKYDTGKACMCGFAEYANQRGKKPVEAVMDAFTPARVPIISTLGMEGAVFDAFHAAIPGPTEPNRIMFMAATSDGLAHNDVPVLEKGLKVKTIFESVHDAGYSYGVYMGDISTAFAFDFFRTIDGAAHLHEYKDLEKHAMDGTLPNFVFVTPTFFPVPGYPANDQHPVHNVLEGERLMKKTYESLRKSPIWNDTAFIVTYDEHGGFSDHVPTPLNGVPNPDGKISTNPPFNFTREGVRIPFVVVSPWVDAKTVVHEAKGPTPTSVYDSTSVAGTVKEMWDLPNFLTKRDAWSGKFQDIFSVRDTPRTDLPMELPKVPENDDVREERARNELMAPTSDLQENFADLVSGITGAERPKSFKNQQEASIWVWERMSHHFENEIGIPYPITRPAEI